MSAFGFLVLIIGVWIVLNADKLGWIVMHKFNLNREDNP